MGENPHCFFIFTPTVGYRPQSLSPGSLQQPLLGLPAPSQLIFSPVHLSHCCWGKHMSDHVSHFLKFPMAHRIKFQLFVLAFQVFHYLGSNCLFNITSTYLYIPSLCYLSPDNNPLPPQRKKFIFKISVFWGFFLKPEIPFLSICS